MFDSNSKFCDILLSWVPGILNRLCLLVCHLFQIIGNNVFTEYSNSIRTNGLSFDKSSGRLSGVYTPIGKKSFDVTGINECGSVSTRITMIFQCRLKKDESKMVQSRAMTRGLNACYFTSADVHIRFDDDWYYRNMGESYINVKIFDIMDKLIVRTWNTHGLVWMIVLGILLC